MQLFAEYVITIYSIVSDKNLFKVRDFKSLSYSKFFVTNKMLEN